MPDDTSEASRYAKTLPDNALLLTIEEFRRVIAEIDPDSPALGAIRLNMMNELAQLQQEAQNRGLIS